MRVLHNCSNTVGLNMCMLQLRRVGWVGGRMNGRRDGWIVLHLLSFSFSLLDGLWYYMPFRRVPAGLVCFNFVVSIHMS